MQYRWPNEETHPALDQALGIVENYLATKQGWADCQQLSNAAKIILDAARNGQNHPVALADKAIVAFGEHSLRKAEDVPFLFFQTFVLPMWFLALPVRR
jgi:hypothetical protein